MTSSDTIALAGVIVNAIILLVYIAILCVTKHQVKVQNKNAMDALKADKELMRDQFKLNSRHAILKLLLEQHDAIDPFLRKISQQMNISYKNSADSIKKHKQINNMLDEYQKLCWLFLNTCDIAKEIVTPGATNALVRLCRVNAAAKESIIKACLIRDGETGGETEARVNKNLELLADILDRRLHYYNDFLAKVSDDSIRQNLHEGVDLTNMYEYYPEMQDDK